MKNLIEKIVQLRNPKFKFDDNILITDIIDIVLSKLMSNIRSLKLIVRFRYIPKLFLGSNVKFQNIRNIKFGKWIKINSNTLLSAYGKNSFLILGDNVSIGSYSSFVVSSSLSDLGKFIKIGNNVGFGDYTHIGGSGGVEIGDDTIIGSYFSCHPSNHNFSDNIKLIRLQGTTKKGIKIGSNCWIGAKVTILDGVTIGNGCVIAAGSVVNKNYEENSIIAGVPAKYIKSRIS
ncbi:MAG TPA: acyltransferase [Flavobacteriaceae bacterium]|nr:acyltransferase [Flavobacteriaceae bacterium]